MGKDGQSQLLMGTAAAIGVVFFWIGMITVTGGILLALGIVGSKHPAMAGNVGK